MQYKVLKITHHFDINANARECRFAIEMQPHLSNLQALVKNTHTNILQAKHIRSNRINFKINEYKQICYYFWMNACVHYHIN